MSKKPNRYSRIIEKVFFKHYKEGATEVAFERSDLIEAADELGLTVPLNIGDIIYFFRYRSALPQTIVAKATAGCEWLIRPAGQSLYRFELTEVVNIEPSKSMVETKIPDATPGVINQYSLSDEQALLAKLRYNRLVDIFTGITCYSLQNHLRTAVPDLGQVETDEIYIGIDQRGAHYVLPVQAKGGSDKIGIVQIEQDMAVCATKFADLICRPLAAQFMGDELIALFELEPTKSGIGISIERHYRLVHPDDLSPDELERYRKRAF